MSQTKPVRTSTWRQTIKAVLARLVFLLILALTFVEWFVDPFPNSLWILRILNTKYLVHVRADLTVDGEPLVMERTIRCFDPVDYHLFPNTPPRGDVLASHGQAGDTLAQQTSKGRLFAILVSDACAAGYTQGLYKVSSDKLQIPVLFEIFGDRKNTQRIDAYIAPDLLLQGYHGVQLKDLAVEQITGGNAPTLLLKDWTSYDWFGTPSWIHRALPGNGSVFDSYMAYIIGKADWNRIAEYNKTHANISQETALKHAQIFEELRTGGPSRKLPDFNPFYVFNMLAHQPTAYSYGFTSSTLIPAGFENVELKKEFWWFLSAVIPCSPLPDGGSAAFICNKDLNGVVSLYPYQPPPNPRKINLQFGAAAYEIDRSDGAFFDSASGQVIGFELVGNVLKGE